MIYNFYELHPKYIKNKIYKGDIPPKLLFQLDTGEQNYLYYMNTSLYKNFKLNYDFAEFIDDMLETNTIYYVISENYDEFYIFEVFKGWSFWDIAEYDERVIIANELNLTKEQAKI